MRTRKMTSQRNLRGIVILANGQVVSQKTYQNERTEIHQYLVEQNR